MKFRPTSQQFDPNAPMVFRRRSLFLGEKREIGDPVPPDVSPQKLRSLWLANLIELAPADAAPPTPPPPPKEPETVSEAPTAQPGRGDGRPASRRDRRRARAAR